MAIYKVSGMNGNGASESRHFEAESEAIALAAARGDGFFPSKVTSVSDYTQRRSGAKVPSGTIFGG